jgi:hypothetical protein
MAKVVVKLSIEQIESMISTYDFLLWQCSDKKDKAEIRKILKSLKDSLK